MRVGDAYTGSSESHAGVALRTASMPATEQKALVGLLGEIKDLICFA